ncbi:MFS transporter [Nocardia macrotermitis]|uniref:Putative proline/betaine transporter n=1 Tax=Nocardia macrotermitis TaxID=2585198 RepID=A0A7K0D031_9NOCA|nr:MFS transporter [Nocardia macrotermitis]MQY18562.1 Inner membrane metabolite transport protein YhjE [Nocardia macrotermitis]
MSLLESASVRADGVREEPGLSVTDTRAAIAASLIGTTVEWYDFFLYSTAAGIVFGKLFFPHTSSFVGTMLSFATFAVGFVMRPVGGLVFGHIGDRIGRKRTLALTMALMGVSTALMGVLPTASAIGIAAPILLLLLRILQGFALGGEWAGAVLLAVEYSPRRKVGIFGSYPQVGLALGLALGTGVFALLRSTLSEAAFLGYGWRIAFGASVVLVAIGLIVRLRIDETPAFREIDRLNRISKVPVVELFRNARNRRNTFLGLLSRWGEGAAFNTWGVFAISFATGHLGLRQVPVLVSVTIAAVVMAALIPLSGLLSDRFGPRRVYMVGIAAFGLLVYPVFALFEAKNIVLFAVGIVAVFGIVHALFYGAQGTLYAGLYPPQVRYTGLSFVYQFSGIYASGVTPMIVTALIAATPGSPWLACGYLAATAVVSVVATWFIDEDDRLTA